LYNHYVIVLFYALFITHNSSSITKFVVNALADFTMITVWFSYF